MSLIETAEKEFEDKYPGYTKQTGPFAEFNKNFPGGLWSNVCYIPINACAKIIKEWVIDAENCVDINADAILMAAFSGWRANDCKIVKVDELINERIYKKYFVEPTICINDMYDKIGNGTYIDADFHFNKKQIGVSFKGVLLNIDHDVKTDQFELRTNFLMENGQLAPFVLELEEGETLTSCIKSTLKSTQDGISKEKQKKVQSIHEGARLKFVEDSMDALHILHQVIYIELLNILEEI